MISQRHDLSMDQGADFELAVTYRDSDGLPIDLTANNYAATFTIKEDIADDAALYSGTSAAGNITLASTEPNLVLLIPYSSTSGFSFDSAHYDIELQRASVGDTLAVDRLLRGKINLLKEVTR